MKNLLNIMKMYLCHLLGDEGQAIGTYMHVDYMLNKNIHKSETFANKEYEHNI